MWMPAFFFIKQVFASESVFTPSQIVWCMAMRDNKHITTYVFGRLMAAYIAMSPQTFTLTQCSLRMGLASYLARASLLVCMLMPWGTTN